LADQLVRRPVPARLDLVGSQRGQASSHSAGQKQAAQNLDDRSHVLDLLAPAQPARAKIAPVGRCSGQSDSTTGGKGGPVWFLGRRFFRLAAARSRSRLPPSVKIPARM